MALNSTAQALLAFTDSQAFEQLCCALLVEEFGTLVPLGGSQDQGRDAIAKLNSFQTEDQAAVFMFSLEKTWSAKVRRDQKTIQANGFKPIRCVFVTNQAVTTTQRQKAIDYAKQEFGWDLEIKDLKWLTARLENPKYVQIRRQYLVLDEMSLPALLDVEEYTERRPDRDFAPDMPTLLGRDSELKDLTDFLDSEDSVLFLSARPGIGKTRLLLEFAKTRYADSRIQVRFLRTQHESLQEMAAELDPKLSYMLVLEEADRFTTLDALVELLKMPEFQGKLKVILSVHPWSLERLQMQVTRFATKSKVVNLSSLSNQDIDELLTKQMVVADENARKLIVRVAEGNPLLAVLGASVWQKGGSFADITKDEVMRAYFREKLAGAFKGVTALREKAYLALAIISATRGIEYSRPEVRTAVSSAIVISDGELDVLIEHLESSGLIRHGWSTVRVFPEILVRHIVWDAFFSKERKYDFREKVINPLLPIYTENIMQTLAEAEALGATAAAPMLNEFLEDALDALGKLDAQGIHRVLQWLKSFAYYRPLPALRILRSILNLSLQPASARIPGWGEWTITPTDILRDCTAVLKEISHRPEAPILREVLILLYRIAEIQDHSRANQFPDGDSRRVLTEQVLSLKPGKPWIISETGAEQIQIWLDNSPNEKQQEVLLACLATLLSISWETIESSVIDANVVTMSQGVFAIDQRMKEFHERLLLMAYKLYEVATPEVKVALIEKISHTLTPYNSNGLTEDVVEYLDELGSTIFPELYQRTAIQALPERWALAQELLGLHRRGKLAALPVFFSELIASDVTTFGYLTEWPGHIHEEGVEHEDWRKAQELHTTFWQTKVRTFLEANGLGQLLAELEQLSALALEAKPDVANTVDQTFGLVARIIEAQPNASELLNGVVAKLPGLSLTLRRAGGHFLRALVAFDLDSARRTITRWVHSKDPELQKAASLGVKAIPADSVTKSDMQAIESLVAANQPELDFVLVSWFWSAFPVLLQVFPDRVAKALNTIASRSPDGNLWQIVELLDDSYSIADPNHLPQLSDDALKEIAFQLVRLERVDADMWHLEGFLAKLFRVDPSAWLEFWEKRIQREKELSGSGRYWAAPFHTTRDMAYILDSPRSTEILGALLEWSAREDWSYNHNGSTLFQLYSRGRPDVIEPVLAAWIKSGDVNKHRAVARVLERIGYGPLFLSVAKDLLDKPDDSLTAGYLRQTVRSTGVVSGSFVPLYESRKKDFQAWLEDPSTPLGPRLFAEEQVKALNLQIAQELRRVEDY